MASNAFDRHHAAASAQVVPQVDVYWKDGSGIAVVASCAGCLLDASLELYSGADPSSAVPSPSALEVTSGPVDEATVFVDLPADVPFGVVVVVALVDEETGAAIEERHTFFARVDKEGKLTEVTWVEFACARGFVQCLHDAAAGADVIDLGLAESAAVDGVEIGVEP